MTKTCPFCNSSEIDEDSGNAICTACGAVLEESAIVADVQFQERGGGHSVIGQFVSRDRAQPTTMGGVMGLPKTESREATYQKGRKRIQEISNQLHINQHCIDLAFGFFKMCVTKNLTRGRLRSHVVVACLYMACRTENTSHLLLDFSDATQINIFDLGRTLNFLTRSLFIKLPPTDPCMYVLRFAAMLDFGELQKEVTLLANRIIQRMKRDWMSTGRRPTGICGAALLLAARALNLNRSVTDIVNVVHISYGVVKKRLDEFANTPSGSLTIDEFNTVDLEESEDPPAFQESKRKKLDEERRKKEEEKADCAVVDFEPVRREVEVALQKKFRHSTYAKMIVGSIKDDRVPELSVAAAQVLEDEVIDTVYNFAEEQSGTSSSNFANYGPSLNVLGLGLGQHQNGNGVPDERANNCDFENGDDELDLTGIDDDEIDTYILTDMEAQVKARYWMARNAEHLKAMEEKRKLKQEKEELLEQQRGQGIAEGQPQMTAPPPRKRRKPNVVRKREPTATNPNEAMLQVIQEKNLSTKINYDILKQMEEDPSPA